MENIYYYDKLEDVIKEINSIRTSVDLNGWGCIRGLIDDVYTKQLKQYLIDQHDITRIYEYFRNQFPHICLPHDSTCPLVIRAFWRRRRVPGNSAPPPPM